MPNQTLPGDLFRVPGRFFKPKRSKRPRKSKNPKFVSHRERTRSRFVPVVYKTLPRYGVSYIETSPDSGKYVMFSDGISITPEPYNFAEVTRDEVHGEAPYRVGGPFDRGVVVPATPNGVVGIGTHITPLANFTVTPFGSGRIKYVGGHQVSMDHWPGVSFDDNWIFDPSNAMSGLTTWHDYYSPNTSGLESQAWSKTMPKMEQGGLGVALAEARDVPHMLHTSSKGFADLYRRIGGNTSSSILSPKKAADHFLNHNFGWVPFIGDLTNLIDNVFNGAAKLDKLIKNNGTWTHCKRTLINQTSADVVFQGEGSMYYPAVTMINSMDSPPSYSITREFHHHAYGVGRFRYYQPYLDNNSEQAKGMLGALRRQLLLHGARLSPAVVYRATKWTWLADWVSSSGSVVDTLNAMIVDNMAAKYFYFCDLSSVKLVLNQTHPWNGRCDAPKSLTCTRFYEFKKRKESSPFGFNFAWDNLNSKQMAIIGALGISRR